VNTVSTYCEDCVDPQRKDPKRSYQNLVLENCSPHISRLLTERKTPYEKVQRNNSVHLLAHQSFSCIPSRRIRSRESECWKLQEAKGQPKHAKEAADHHGKELRLDPEEDGGEE